MNTIITGHQFEMSPELRQFIEQKAEQKLVHFADRIHHVYVNVHKEHVEFKTECDVTSDLGEFFASAHAEIVETSIDQTLDKVLAEIRKKHSKITDHHKH